MGNESNPINSLQEEQPLTYHISSFKLNALPSHPGEKEAFSVIIDFHLMKKQE